MITRTRAAGLRARAWAAATRFVCRGSALLGDRPWRTLEITLGIPVLVILLTGAPRALIRVWLTVAYGAATSLIPLLRVDAAATLRSLALGVGRIGLATVPTVLLLRSVPRYRWVWLLPLIAMMVMVSSAFSLAAGATARSWALLVLASGVTSALTRVRVLRWSALLPFLLLCEIVPEHTLAPTRTASAAYRGRILATCGQHGGARPRNLTADRIMPFHGITNLTDELVLLTGEGPLDGAMRDHTGGRRVGSWWMRRRPDGGFDFERESGVSGNLWRGCILDGTIWMARANMILGVKRLSGDSPHEQVYQVRVPADEIDFVETACDVAHGHLYVTEAFNDGMWEVQPDGSNARRHRLGGVMLIAKQRFDGKLVVTNNSALMVFAPGEGRVVERVPAGLADFGFDVCQSDGSVAVSDMSGRLRVFTLDGTGHYRFRWGVSLFAPRRVAYSRDCSRIAVTSTDDHRVFMIDAATHAVAQVFHAGPALREVAATGPREFSIADDCSLTTYRW